MFFFCSCHFFPDKLILGISFRYGDQAAEITHDGLGAAGHAFGTAWSVFKIRKALNPKSAMKPSTLAKSSLKAAANEVKASKGK